MSRLSNRTVNSVLFGSASTKRIRSGLNALPSSSATARAIVGRELVRRLRAREQAAEDPRHLALHLVRHADRRGLAHGRVRDGGRLELGRADPLAGDVERVVGAPVQEPEPVLVDRGPVAVRPDAREARASTSRGSARGRARSRASCRGTAGGRRARRPRPCRRASCPSSSTTSIAMPSAGPPTEHALIGPIGVGERKQAPTSVPPEQLMIGTRAAADVLEQPAVRLGVPRLAGRHERAERREVAPSASPCGSSARTSVGERPSDVTPSSSTSRQSRSASASRARPRRRRSSPPSAPTPTTRPRAHDPAHVGREVDDVARVHVGLVGDLARDRDEEAALHVHDALRPAGRAGRVREQVRVLRVDLERPAARPGQGVELERREHDVLDATAPRAAPPRGSRASARASRGASDSRLRDHDLRLARLQPLRDRRRGEAREDRHLDRADVRARVRGDRDLGRHRQEDRDAVARLDAERDERLREPRHVARELGERQLAARAVLAEPDRRDAVGTRAPPSGARSCGRVEPARRRTRSPTPARASRRAPASTASRTRAPGPRRRAARTTPGSS